METRYSAIEPHAPGSPNGANVSAEPHAAPPAPAVARLMSVDELPLSAEDCALGEVVAGKYLDPKGEEEAAAAMEFVLEGLHQASLVAKEEVVGGRVYRDTFEEMVRSFHS